MTIARPSGDQLGRPGSLSGSCALRTSPVFTLTMRSSDVGERNAICVLSGDHAALIASGVTLRSRPLGISRSHRSIAPSRSLEKASADPSGAHAGSASENASVVRRAGAVFPVAAISQRSPNAPNTTCAPSGEIAGCVMPRTVCGPCGASEWCLGVNAALVKFTAAENSTVRAAPPFAGRRLILPSAVRGSRTALPTAAEMETHPRRRRRCPCLRPSAARRRRPMPPRARQDSTTVRVRP